MSSKLQRRRRVRQVEPDDDETYSDFMDRCFDELGDADVCQMIWDERAGDGEVIRKTHASKTNGMEFVLSDETPDRMDDVIMSDGWQLDNFRKNPIALFGHRSDFPIGTWKDLRVEKKQLIGRLDIAPEGTSERIDEIRRLIDAGILRAVSVGFKPIETKPRKETGWGVFYTKAELVETSVVSVPANPNALAIAKSMKISAATIDLVFAGKGTKGDLGRRSFNGGQASRKSDDKRRPTMSLAQRIVDAEKRLVELRDKLAAHFDNVDDTNVSDQQLETANELNAKITQEEKNLAALREAEKHLAGTADASSHSVIVRQQQQPERPAAPALSRPFSIAPKKLEPMDFLVRAGTVQLFAHLLRKPVDEVRHTIYGDDEATKAVLEWSIKAASTPATSFTPGWAQELVQQIVVDFMALLMPKSIFPRLSGYGLSLSFGRNGKIVIPTRARTPTIAGSFVGEGQPIPIRQGAFASQTLVPKKMAVITTWTREIDEHSVPAVEGLLRNAIQEDTAVSLDFGAARQQPGNQRAAGGPSERRRLVASDCGRWLRRSRGRHQADHGRAADRHARQRPVSGLADEPAADQQCGPHHRSGRRRLPVPHRDRSRQAVRLADHRFRHGADGHGDRGRCC